MAATSPFLTEQKDSLLLKVLIQPRASKDEVKGIQDGRLKVRLKAPPVDGEANKALIAYIAKLLGVKKLDIEIKDGLTSRRKTILIEGLSKEGVLKVLDIP